MCSVRHIKLLLLILLLGEFVPTKAQLVYGEDGLAQQLFQKTPCLTDEARADIHRKLKARVEQLRAKNLLPAATTRDATLLGWPLKATSDFEGFSYFTISNYVDLNEAYPNQVQDYNCGSRSYDNADGYNHAGTDFSLFPKAWELMENDAVAVVAAERGTIIEKEDGHFDKNCSLNSSGNWNAIYIQHADGSSAWYGHLKANSLTGKGIGSTVERGEYLGIVGSSGASTAPHLHLELYNAQGEVIDPFAGACNGTVENSWWVKQRDYHDSAINQLEVSRFLPESDNCEEPNISNENNSFCANDEVHFIAWLRDLQYSQILQHSILRPDQSTFEYWENSLPGSQGDYLPASMVSQSFVLPRDPQPGVWKYTVRYEGRNYTQEFDVCDESSLTPLRAIKLNKFFPNPTSDVLNLQMQINEQGVYQFEVMSITGQMIYKKERRYLPGATQLVLPTADYDAGIYVLTIRNANTGERYRVQRFVKH